MASYPISEQTRMKLIQAAGELFAAKGIEGVTTREIARKAGTVQNAISYHFNGLNGLIEAVWEYAVNEWRPSRFTEYLEAREELLNDRAGRIQLVTGAIHLLFDIMFQEDHPLWINKFLVRSALTDEGRESVARVISGSVVPALIDLYERLTNKPDPAAAHCWSMRILAAPMVFTANLTAFSKMQSQPGVFNFELYRKLRDVTIRDALFAVGILPDA